MDSDGLRRVAKRLASDKPLNDSERLKMIAILDAAVRDCDSPHVAASSKPAPPAKYEKILITNALSTGVAFGLGLWISAAFVGFICFLFFGSLLVK